MTLSKKRFKGMSKYDYIIFNMKWKIFQVIELLEKGKTEKALKILKEMIYK